MCQKAHEDFYNVIILGADYAENADSFLKFFREIRVIRA